MTTLLTVVLFLCLAFSIVRQDRIIRRLLHSVSTIQDFNRSRERLRAKERERFDALTRRLTELQEQVNQGFEEVTREKREQDAAEAMAHYRAAHGRAQERAGDQVV